jgi:hypothetical protein
MQEGPFTVTKLGDFVSADHPLRVALFSGQRSAGHDKRPLHIGFVSPPDIAIRPLKSAKTRTSGKKKAQGT